MLLSHGRGGVTDREKPNESQLSIMSTVLSDSPSHVVGQIQQASIARLK